MSKLELQFYLLNDTISMRALNSIDNTSKKYQLKLDSFPPELLFLYRDLKTFYRAYIVKRQEFIELQQENQNAFIKCRIPMQHLHEKQYPMIRLKINETLEDPNIQITNLKNKIKNLQSTIDSFYEVFMVLGDRKQMIQQEQQIQDKIGRVKDIMEQFRGRFIALEEKINNNDDRGYKHFGGLPSVKIDGQILYVHVIFVSGKFKMPKNTKVKVFVMGGGGCGGRGGTSYRGGGGSGYLQYGEIQFVEEQIIDMIIGEGGKQTPGPLGERKPENNGNPTIFKNIRADGGKMSGQKQVIEGGEGGSGGGAGQGSNTNSGANGGTKGSSGADSIYNNSSWKGGEGKSAHNFVKAQKFGLIAGKGGDGGLGNSCGHEAGGGGGGICIPREYYRGMSLDGGDGQGLYPGRGGKGFGGGGGGGSYDSNMYNYGGNGAQGCIVLFLHEK